jgi:hypothetical protein
MVVDNLFSTKECIKFKRIKNLPIKNMLSMKAKSKLDGTSTELQLQWSL